jgi:hypothetical protein
MNEVHVHIDRLVLDGVTLEPGGAARFGAAVEAAVADALRTRGLSSELGSGGAFAAVPAGRAGRLDGTAVGAAVAEGLAGGPGEARR